MGFTVKIYLLHLHIENEKENIIKWGKNVGYFTDLTHPVWDV